MDECESSYDMWDSSPTYSPDKLGSSFSAGCTRYLGGGEDRMLKMLDQQAAASGGYAYSIPYVESPTASRTMLADIFSILFMRRQIARET